MRILFAVQQLGRGGAERQLVTLARSLHERGSDVHVAVFYRGGAFDEELRVAGVPTVFLGASRRRGLPLALLRLAWLVCRLRPTVVHPYLVVPNLVCLPLKLVRPGTKVVWGVRHAELDLTAFDALIRVSETLARPASRLADLIVVNSEAGRRSHAALGYPEHKLVVVPNGIDVERFQADRSARARQRDTWGVGEHTVLVGMVARVDPTKDHERFLRSVALARREVPELRAVCVGAVKPEELERLRVHEPHAIFTGAIDDVVSAYSALDIGCLASRTEGFPNVVAEAMSCGVPCVVADVGDAAAIVGDTGEVVSDDSDEAMANAICQLVRRLATHPALGDQARRRISDTYGIDQLVDRTCAALARVGAA